MMTKWTWALVLVLGTIAVLLLATMVSAQMSSINLGGGRRGVAYPCSGNSACYLPDSWFNKCPAPCGSQAACATCGIAAKAEAPTANFRLPWSQITGVPTTTVVSGTTSTTMGGGGTAGGWTERDGDVLAQKPAKIEAGYGRNSEPALLVGDTSYLSKSGGHLASLQALPHPRGQWVEVGTRYNGGGYPYSNGFSWVVTKRGRTTDWYEPPPLGRGIVRRPAWKFRQGQLVYAGNAGTETPGAQWRVVADCETGKAPLLLWCATLGCVQADGTCQFRREAQWPVAFTDGTAEFGPTWGADAYAGVAAVTIGPDSPNTPAVEKAGGDNITGKDAEVYPNVAGAPFYTSMARMGTGWHRLSTTGDPRSGAYEHEINALWNPRVWRLGSAVSFQPPWLPLLVRTVANPKGTFPQGASFIFTMQWEDETKQQSTAVSERSASVTVPGAGYCIEIQVDPSNGHWPSVGGSREKVRALIFSGSKDYYCTYAGSIEKPAVGGTGLGNDRLTFCTPDELYETQTCQQFSLNTKSVVLMGDPDVRAPAWRPGERVKVGRDIRTPRDSRDPFPWVPESANSSPDCSTGFRAYTAECVTGTTEPNWHAVGFNLAYDNGCCWRRLSMIGFAHGVQGPEIKFTENPSVGLPRIVSRTETDGTTTLYDATKPQSYLFPQTQFGRGGLTFYEADGVTVKRAYTADGVVP